MKQASIDLLTEHFIERLSRQWMLVTAGGIDHFNTMTASWGGIGYLWNKPVAFVFVRPERYTFEFIEKNDSLTLSFFRPEDQDMLRFCGSHSGRDTDKIAGTGLIPRQTPSGNVIFEQGILQVECRKLYAGDLKEEHFIDRTLPGKWYGPQQGQYHRMYVVEILHLWADESHF